MQNTEVGSILELRQRFTENGTYLVHSVNVRKNEELHLICLGLKKLLCVGFLDLLVLFYFFVQRSGVVSMNLVQLFMAVEDVFATT
ncbi:hypothetical protein DGG96_14500 [Legionella qingyii]|uniref:Uncharacterized protein n=1 Tax=Legionella qingyii TaxID=2184757 RepID=A0A317U0Q5_9GAMM|nr:hypothetical protein DGG96_14500 [Legionella qingyii]